MNSITKEDDGNLADIIWWIKGYIAGRGEDNHNELGMDHIESLRRFRLAFRASDDD